MVRISVKSNYIFLSIIILFILALSACIGGKIHVIETEKTDEIEKIELEIDNCKGEEDVTSEATYNVEIDVRGASELGVNVGAIKENISANLGVQSGFAIEHQVKTPAGYHGTHTVTLEYTVTKGLVTRDRTNGEAEFTVKVPKSVTNVKSDLEKCQTAANKIHIEAEQYDKESAHVEIVESSEGGRLLGWIDNGEWVSFENVDFGSGGYSTFNARVASAENGGEIEIRLDDPNGQQVGVCRVNGTGGWQNWETVSCGLTSDITGTRTVYLIFKGGDTYLFNINWVEFSP